VVRIPKPCNRHKTDYQVVLDIFNAAYSWLLSHNYLLGYYNITWEVTGPREITIVAVHADGRHEIAVVFIGRKYLHIMPLVDPKR